MVKKRRLAPANKNKAVEKSPQSNDEVLSARDRFKGALQDLLPHSEEESESSDDEQWTSNRSRRLSMQKKKSVTNDKPETTPGKFQQAFVMKLFDRSVDLAQFSESTPLYPICRAWIANHPHQVYEKESSPENKEEREIKEEGIPDEQEIETGKDVYSLTPPKPAPKNSTTRIPEIIPYKSKHTTFDQDDKEPPSKDEILNDNLAHWKKVRKSWAEAAAKNELRYAESFKILTAIYNKAQANYSE